MKKKPQMINGIKKYNRYEKTKRIVQLDKEDNYHIINTHTPETTSVIGKKSWVDFDDNDNLRPTEITVNLLADGEVYKTVTISEEDEWKYSFTELPVYKAGV